MKDSLGDRMKSYYEDRTRIKLQRRTYTIIRLDGCAFHTYTKGLKKPFDLDLVVDMNETAIQLVKEIPGAKFAYVQSDEISILLTDFDKLGTQAWFDNNLQKMCSVSASIATQHFNKIRNRRAQQILDSYHDYETIDHEDDKMIDLLSKTAIFDSRVFQLPTKTEVMNYFLWRQRDCVRNSISTVAQSLYSHKELEGVGSNELQEMIFQKGENWNNYYDGVKRGRLIMKKKASDDKATKSVGRTTIVSESAPHFSLETLGDLIPENL